MTKSEQSKELKVLGAGFGRTGTASLQMALNELGFKTYHMFEVRKTGHNNLIHSYFSGEDKTQRKWLDAVVEDGYDAGVDFPISLAYKKVLEIYPNAKIILTRRKNPEQWMKSFENLISSTGGLMELSQKFFPDDRSFVEDMLGSACAYDMVYIELPWVKFGNYARFRDREKCKQFYLDHLEEVRAYVPANQLLDVETSELNYDILADFVGVAPPPKGTPYPRINSSKSLQIMSDMFRFVILSYPLILLILGYVLYRLGCACCGRSKPKDKMQ
mmetsp:Transcript_19771/g.36652  ORF Transcript_19771/g.36652 Transcript_19771/m.36652 type:complete len:273 (-) Transcript_19771:2263-3081(-)